MKTTFNILFFSITILFFNVLFNKAFSHNSSNAFKILNIEPNYISVPVRVCNRQGNDVVNEYRAHHFERIRRQRTHSNYGSGFRIGIRGENYNFQYRSYDRDYSRNYNRRHYYYDHPSTHTRVCRTIYQSQINGYLIYYRNDNGNIVSTFRNNYPNVNYIVIIQ